MKILSKDSQTIVNFDNVQTPQNHYVIETSSNLNENPKMEQFNWENDKDLYLWYEALFKELMK